MVVLLDTIFACSTHVAPDDSCLKLSTYTVLVQLSDGGSKTMAPANVVTANGFTFTLIDA